MKKYVITFVEKVHLRMFGHEMSDQMRNFLSNMSWSFYSGIIAVPVSILISTLGGRFIGPEDFGKYNLVVLISSYLSIFVFFGLDISSIKKVVKAKNDLEKRQAFFSSFVFISMMILIVLVFGLSFSSQIANFFHVERYIIIFSLIYTALLAIKAATDSLMRGLEKFKRQAIGRIIESLVMITTFLLFFLYFKHKTYPYLLLSIFFSSLSLSIFYFSGATKYFKGFSLKILKEQLAEGKLFMLCSLLGTIFISSDRLFIAKYLNYEALGIYSAYYTGSITLTAVLSVLFTNVLLPATAKTEDKGFTVKFDQIFYKGFFPFFILISLALSLFLLIFGKSYPFKIEYILLFSLISTIYLFSNMLNTVILDIGRKKYFAYLLSINLINLITIVYYYLIIKQTKSITFILIGFLANLIINFIIQRYFITQMNKAKSDEG